jgi:hypothetical protein
MPGGVCHKSLFVTDCCMSAAMSERKSCSGARAQKEHRGDAAVLF